MYAMNVEKTSIRALIWSDIKEFIVVRILMNVKSVEGPSRETQTLSYTREFIVEESHMYVMYVGRPSIKAQIL